MASCKAVYSDLPWPLMIVAYFERRILVKNLPISTRSDLSLLLCSAEPQHTMPQPGPSQLAPELWQALLAGLDRRQPVEQFALPAGEAFLGACDTIYNHLAPLDRDSTWEELGAERAAVQLLRWAQPAQACAERSMLGAAPTWPAVPPQAIYPQKHSPKLTFHASLAATCSALAALGERVANLGRELNRSNTNVHLLLSGLAVAGNGVCLALKAFHRCGRLGVLGPAVLAGALRWPAAALVPLSESMRESLQMPCSDNGVRRSREGQPVSVTGDTLRRQLEGGLSDLACAASLLLEFWNDAKGSKELQGQPAEVLAAAAGSAVRREVRWIMLAVHPGWPSPYSLLPLAACAPWATC